MANKINVVLGLDTTAFQRSIGRVEKQLQQFGSRLESVGTTLSQRLTLPLLAAGAASVKAFADFEKLSKGLAAVMGSSEAAEAELVKLREVAKLPGLGFKEAVQGSVNLQAVGLSADQARQTLRGFGAAIAATGGGAMELQEVQRQLTQIISKNRILQEDYGVLQERVPLIGKALQAAFGTTNIENVRAMGISGQEFVQRISEALIVLPQTQNLTGGLANSLENLRDSLQNSAAQFGQAINKAIDLEGIISKVAAAVQRAADGFSALNPDIQKNIVLSSAGAAAIGPLLFAIGSFAKIAAIASTGLKSLGTALTFMTGPVGITIAAIAALVAGIVIAYRRSAEFREFVDRLGYTLKFVLAKAFELVQNEVRNVATVIKALAPIFKPAIDVIIQFAKLFFERFKFIAGIALDVAGFIVAVMVGAAKSVRLAFSTLFQELKADFASFGKGIKQIFEGNIRQGVNTITSEFSDTGSKFGEAFKDGFEDGFKGTKAFFKNVAGAFNTPVFAQTGKATGSALADRLNEENQQLPTAPTPPKPPGGTGTGTGARIAQVGEIAPLPTLALPTQLDATAEAALRLAARYETLALTGEALKTQQTGLFESMRQNAMIASEEVTRMLDGLNLAMTNTGQIFVNWSSIMGSAISGGLSTFSQSIEGGIKSLKQFGNAVRNAAQQAVSALIKEGVTAVIAKTLVKLGGALGPLAIPLAAAAGSLAAGVFNSAINSIAPPRLAKGGLVVGEQVITAGDNPSGKEAIIPFERMGQFLDMAGGGKDVRVTGLFELRGSDLVLVLDRAKQEQLRVR